MHQPKPLSLFVFVCLSVSLEILSERTKNFYKKIRNKQKEKHELNEISKSIYINFIENFKIIYF